MLSLCKRPSVITEEQGLLAKATQHWLGGQWMGTQMDPSLVLFYFLSPCLINLKHYSNRRRHKETASQKLDQEFCYLEKES